VSTPNRDRSTKAKQENLRQQVQDKITPRGGGEEAKEPEPGGVKAGRAKHGSGYTKYISRRPEIIDPDAPPSIFVAKHEKSVISTIHDLEIEMEHCDATLTHLKLRGSHQHNETVSLKLLSKGIL